MQRVLLEGLDDEPDDRAVTENGHSPNRSGHAFPRPMNTRHDEGYIPRRKVSGWHSRAIDRGGLGWTISGRTREGRFITNFENLLVDHLGREPSITEKLLIQRCARMACHLELMDEASLARGESFAPSDNVRYCAWSNGLARMLVRLGLEPTKIDEPRFELSDWVQDRAKRYNHGTR